METIETGARNASRASFYLGFASVFALVASILEYPRGVLVVGTGLAVSAGMALAATLNMELGDRSPTRLLRGLVYSLCGAAGVCITIGLLLRWRH